MIIQRRQTNTKGQENVKSWSTLIRERVIVFAFVTVGYPEDYINYVVMFTELKWNIESMRKAPLVFITVCKLPTNELMTCTDAPSRPQKSVVSQVCLFISN